MAPSLLLLLLALAVVCVKEVSCQYKLDHIEKLGSCREPTSKKRVRLFSVNGGDTVKLTWTEAFLFCRAMNTHLASVENLDEYNLLKEKLRSLPSAEIKSKRFWLAAIRDNSYEWVWIGSGKPLNFKPWANNQPSKKGSCLEISSGPANNKNTHNDNNPFKGGPQLYSSPCEKENNFICQSILTIEVPCGAGHAAI